MVKRWHDEIGLGIILVGTVLYLEALYLVGSLGYKSKPEVEVRTPKPQIERVLEQYDTNRNGVLERSELSNLLENQ